MTKGTCGSPVACIIELLSAFNLVLFYVAGSLVKVLFAHANVYKPKASQLAQIHLQLIVEWATNLIAASEARFR